MGLEKIVEYKKKLGLTNEQLATLSGVPKGTLDKILSGITKDPKLGTLKALARVFNCTLDDFDDFDNLDNNISLSNEEEVLISNFNKLNDLGKNEANKRVAELAEISKYIKINDATELITATKDETSIALEDMFTTIAAHDDDLTEDEKLEADRRILEALKKMKK